MDRVFVSSVKVTSPTSPTIGREDLYACVTSRNTFAATSHPYKHFHVRVASPTPLAIGREDLYACVTSRNAFAATSHPYKHFRVCIQWQISIPNTISNWQRGYLRLRYLTEHLCCHIPPIQTFPCLYPVSG